MNKAEKLFALEAALVAAEDVIPPSMRGHSNDLLQFLGDVLSEAVPDFGAYLTIQKGSVQKLADNPQVFGAK